MGIIAEDRAKIKPGDQFERWTVLGMPFTTNRPKSTSVVVCQCECGEVAVVYQGSLLKGASKSCGCLNRDAHIKHGLTHSGKTGRLYKCWEGMRARCGRVTDPSYARYGGRGISVCEEWACVETFAGWAMGNGYDDSKTLDRINNDGNYEPSNCRWATPKEQGRNRSDNKHVVAFGETKLLCEWAEDKRCKVKPVTLKYRLRNGWPPEKAISQPSRGLGAKT